MNIICMEKIQANTVFNGVIDVTGHAAIRYFTLTSFASNWSKRDILMKYDEIAKMND